MEAKATYKLEVKVTAERDSLELLSRNKYRCVNIELNLVPRYWIDEVPDDLQ